MPELRWLGKDKVVNHHLDVPFRVLDPQYTAGTPDSGNRIIHGDNLEALKALLPYYEGRIKCIYIDPPYNTGNENWVYNDNVNDPKIKRWLGKVVGKESEDLSRHDKWLCMMYPRLVLLHKLLADDGVIFISIDYNAECYLRLVMNEIFGGSNFRNCIAVRRGIKNVQAQFKDIAALSVGHEYIFLYSKNTSTRLPKLSKDLTEEKAGKWDTFWRGTDRPTMRYKLFGIEPKRGQWRWEEKRALIANDNLQRYKRNFSDKQTLDEFYFDHLTATNEKLDFVRLSQDGVVQYFVPPQGTKLVSDNWMDILLSGSYADFDTEKNVEIIERAFKWICEQDNDCIILDSFAGSGTTAHAVLNLNKQDGRSGVPGNRKFILVEMEDYAETITAERVRRVMDGYGSMPGTGGGFTYYELGEPLFTDDGLLNANLPVDRIREYIWYSETRTPLPTPATPGEETPGVDSPGRSAGAVDSPYFLGKLHETAYYLYYEPDALTTLDYDFLSTLQTRAGQYIIYADNCLIARDWLQEHRIIVKKIPRDISKF